MGEIGSESREEGEIGSESREEGEIGSESREKGDLPPCYTPPPSRIELRSYRGKASTIMTPPSLLHRINTTEKHLRNQGGARLVGTSFSFQYVHNSSSNGLLV